MVSPLPETTFAIYANDFPPPRSNTLESCHEKVVPWQKAGYSESNPLYSPAQRDGTLRKKDFLGFKVRQEGVTSSSFNDRIHRKQDDFSQN